MMDMMWEELLSRGERSKTVRAANMRGANDPRARENLLGSERGGYLINISVLWLIIKINIKNIIINNILSRRKVFGIREGRKSDQYLNRTQHGAVR